MPFSVVKRGVADVCNVSFGLGCFPKVCGLLKFATTNEVLRGDCKFGADAVESACTETREILGTPKSLLFRLRNYSDA